jgi:hypothetical protein
MPDRYFGDGSRLLVMVEEWEVAELHCFQSLRSNAELVGRQWPASKEVNTEAGEATK